MKVSKLVIKNIGLIESMELPLDKPLIIFYGEIRQGKTTILNAVRWCFGGSFPADILRHGADEGAVALTFADGSTISREWYVARDKTTKARPITFVRGGLRVANPVDAIKQFLNPFLLNQNHLVEMGEPERKRFFAELFNVESPEENAKLANVIEKAKELRSKISGYGVIELTPVTLIDGTAIRQSIDSAKRQHSVNLDAVRSMLQKVRSDYATQCEFYRTETAKIGQKNSAFSDIQRLLNDDRATLARLEDEVEGYKARIIAREQWLKENPLAPSIAAPTPPDTAALEAKLSEQVDTTALETQFAEAAASQVRFDQYTANLKRQAQKQVEENQLAALEQEQKKIQNEKIARLKSLSESCGVPGLSFEEDGSFSFEGTSAGMLSTSQLMRLSSILSGTYPDGFGLDLIDRGESLGKSIFSFIKRAQAEEKTILATVVGEKPAAIPEHVGVFVVEHGKLV